jgi:hypothetical protein
MVMPGDERTEQHRTEQDSPQSRNKRAVEFDTLLLFHDVM